jgi:DNA-binding MarR family transcriptional regulator
MLNAAHSGRAWSSVPVMFAGRKMNQYETADAHATARTERELNKSRGPQLGPLGELVGFHLRLAQDASFRAFARHSGIPDLKPGRFATMMVIRANPGITHVALSRAIARDKSTVTPLIKDLERRGLVSRVRSRSDRRKVTLTLTGSGEKMLDRLRVHAEAHDRQLDAIVGGQKLEFIRLLRKIADVLGNA